MANPTQKIRAAEGKKGLEEERGKKREHGDRFVL